MKTNVVMESYANRLIRVGETEIVVRQRTKDKFFNLKDLCLICDRLAYLSNQPRFDINQYFRLNSSKLFLEALEKRKGIKIIYKSTKNSDGWVHPHIFLDILLWANPDFKVDVYDWLFDYLIENRINSSDSYRLMCAAVYEFCNRKDKFKKEIIALSNKIKELIGVDDWNKASETQLKQRDELQNMIADLTVTLRDAANGSRLAIENHKRKYIIKENIS